MFGYSLNYLIDMENAVILDVEATPTRISKEVDATETMIERVEERFALKPDRLAGDVAYGTSPLTRLAVIDLDHGPPERSSTFLEFEIARMMVIRGILGYICPHVKRLSVECREDVGLFGI